MNKSLPRSLFVLGGAASGKSSWAEAFLEERCSSMAYVATGQAFDAEMQNKIELHKIRRNAAWTTIEAPFEPVEMFDHLGGAQALLIDCATMWLSNHLLAENDLEAAQSRFISGLKSCPIPWVVVSNEVGQGIVPDNALARRFREAQGRVNIALAAQAECAVQITAGLPRVLKGTLP